MMEIIFAPSFLEQVQATGEYLRQKLEGIAGRDGRAVTVKGLGLLLGIEFAAEVKGLVDICLKNGLLLISAGPRVLRLVPPLNITRGEVEEAVGILEQSLQEWDP